MNFCMKLIYFYNDTTYHYECNKLNNISYDTKVTDYICDKDIEKKGLVFAYLPGLYATYDYEVDFEDFFNGFN